MADFWSNLTEQFDALTMWELSSTALLLIYVVLAAKGNRWCWLPGIVGSAIMGCLVWQANLYLEAGLQVYYVAMGIYGWLHWSKAKEQTGSESGSIKKMTHKEMLLVPLLGLLLAFTAGYIFDRFLGNALPYLDSFTTVFSLIATWMVARKLIENWLYWIVVDLAAIYLYGYKGFVFFAVLYLLYVCIAIAGYFSWRRQMKAQA